MLNVKFEIIQLLFSLMFVATTPTNLPQNRVKGPSCNLIYERRQSLYIRNILRTPLASPSPLRLTFHERLKERSCFPHPL